MQSSLFIEKAYEDPRTYMQAQAQLNQEILNHLRTKVKNRQGVFFPGNTPSLKNSKQIMALPTKLSVCHKAELYKDIDKVWKCSSCKQPAQRLTRNTLQPSKNVQEYVKSINHIFLQHKPTWLNMIHNKPAPLQLGYYPIRDSYRQFDFDNVHQVILDQMQAHEWLRADSAIYIMSHPIGFHVNKNTPGIIITLLDDTIMNWKKERYW